MKIQQENIREYPKIREIREHFLLWTIPIIQYIEHVKLLFVIYSSTGLDTPNLATKDTENNVNL